MKKPKTYAIRPIDMKAGDYIIVSEWYEDTVANDNPYVTKKPLGIPMKVLALALPFIAVEFCGGVGTKGVLDTRRSAFIRVGRAYVDALGGKGGPVSRAVAIVKRPQEEQEDGN